MRRLIVLLICCFLAWAGRLRAQDPQCPELIGRWGYGACRAVAADDDYVYVGNGTVLQIYCIDDRAHPLLTSEIMLDGVIYGITLEEVVAAGDFHRTAGGPQPMKKIHNDKRQNAGKYAYIAASKAGLIIVDITDPLSPRVLGRADTPDGANAVAVRNGYAYLTVSMPPGVAYHEGTYGLYIFDVWDRSNPVQSGFADIICAMGVAVRGEYAFVASWCRGLKIINIQDKSAPYEAAHFNTAILPNAIRFGPGPGGSTLGYLCGDYGLEILDFGDPLHPVRKGSFDWWAAWDIAFKGNVAYVAGLYSGFYTLDVTDPTNPQWMLGWLETRERMPAVAAPDGDFVYISDWTGLKVADVSDPTWPVPGDYIKLGFITWQIHMDGTLAYIACDLDGVLILDFSEPGRPRKVGRFASENRVYNMTKAGQLLYIHDSWNLRILDVSEPTTPREISRLRIPCEPGFVGQYEGYLFINCHEASALIINATDPHHPFEAGHLDFRPGLGVRALFDSYLIAADDEQYMIIVDISTPSDPREVWSTDEPHSGGWIAIGDQIAYETNYAGRLAILSLENPENPHWLGSAYLDGDPSPSSIAVKDGRVFIGAWPNDAAEGLYAYDASDPAAIRKTGFFRTPGYVSDLAVSGSRLYVADTEAGIEVFDVSGCGVEGPHSRPLGPP